MDRCLQSYFKQCLHGKVESSAQTQSIFGNMVEIPRVQRKTQVRRMRKKGPMAYGKELNVPVEGFHLIVTE